MIHLCTCTGGSTSTVNASKRRSGSLSCKNCGGKPAIDGNRSSSSCLLSTVLELTSLINSDFTWTKVSKGCRSSSRRPRRSNTINLAGEELLSNDSKGFDMPVSESEKLGVSVLGCHFSEKAEHIPIKKRRFLFRASSPPRNSPIPSLDGTGRNATSLKDSSHGLQLNPNATCLSTASEAINDDKMDVKQLVKAGEDEDFSGISILAAAACSNSLGVDADRCEGSGIISCGTKSPEAPMNIEFKENDLKSTNICTEESDSHTSTIPSKGVDDSSPSKFALDNSSPDESTLDNSSSQAPLESAVSKTNQEESMIQKSSARDVRLNWDLNTVMDAWEEPFGTEHEISTSNAAAHDNLTSIEEKSNDFMKESERESGCASKNISNLILPSQTHENDELKLGKLKPDGANDAISVATTLNVENPTNGIFANWENLSGKDVVDTKLSMDCSIPPGFDHCLNTRASKENVGIGDTVNFLNSTTLTVSIINPKTEYEKHDLSLTTASFLENGAHQSMVTSNKDEDKSKVKMVLTSNGNDLDLDLPHEFEDQPAALSSMPDAEAPLENGFGRDNSQSDNKAGSGIDKLDELSIGYDSQYEDGELRDSSMHTWKGYEPEHKENEANLDLGIPDVHEASSQCEQKGSSRIKPTEPDVLSSVLLPEKLQLHSSDEVSGSGPNEIIVGQEDGKRPDVVKEASQSDEWKMNVSGWDMFPENHRNSSNNFTKTRNFSGRKFSYREQKDGFEHDDVETKAEGSRFYRKESLTRIGGPSTRDTFINRSRFRMQGCSSKAADDLPSRPERETGGLRSFGRGRYSPPSRATGRGGGMWNRSPERKRLPSPSYQNPSFLRSMLDDVGPIDNITNEPNMDQSNNSSYITRRSFRSRSPTNREENDFRARLGLRPTGDTSHDRFTNLGRGRGRGRTVRYGSRLNGGGPRSRYHGPANDECDELLTEYSNPFPRRRRCFSPIERRYPHHRSDSRSPSRPRTRSPIGNPGFRRRSSRSPPNFRPDTRIRRPRSPTYRRGFEDHANEYNPGPRNNTSPPPRWVNYKERPAGFDRRSPPPGRADPPLGERERERERERFNFYDSSRKPKQNEYYRSGHPGRFSDRPRYNDGYRRGGFVRKRFEYDEQDSFDLCYDSRDKQALEFHARANNNNSKAYSNGTTTDSRFRDFPRRVRDDADGGFKRRKDPSGNEESEQHVTDDSQRRSTTNLDSTPNEAIKEGDKDKPMLGSN